MQTFFGQNTSKRVNTISSTLAVIGSDEKAVARLNFCHSQAAFINTKAKTQRKKQQQQPPPHGVCSRHLNRHEMSNMRNVYETSK